MGVSSPAMTDELKTRWRPLSVRESGNYAAYDALHPGVPSWLRTSLWRWVAARLHNEDALLRVERRFRTELVDPSYGYPSAIAQLQGRAFADEEFFLDVVDVVLSELDPRVPPDGHPFYADRRADQMDVANLAKMLNEAGSVWRVGATDERLQLQRRVESTVETAAEQVMRRDGKPAQHLRLAWSAVYGRHPDAGKGYGEAIKAVEAAAIPVVLPKTGAGTLGKVIAALRDKPTKWAVVLKHPEPERQVLILADMMDLIWKGQTGRHGDPDPNAPISVTQEQAEATVHLAVTVVQWFTVGVVTAR
jgi:hypothetical protein